MPAPMGDPSGPLRRPMPGDFFDVSVSDRFTDSATGASSLWTGTYHEAVSTITDQIYGSVLLDSQTGMQQVTAGNGVGQSKPIIYQKIYRIDESGHRRWIGSIAGGKTDYIVQPDGGPAPVPDDYFRIGANYGDGGVVFKSGATESYSEQVVAVETVTVPLGTFRAFRVDFTQTVSSADGQSISFAGSYWTVPAIGAIKTTSAATFTQDGRQQAESYTEQATATNVPLP